MSADWPYRCTGSIALVLSVIAASIALGIHGEGSRIDIDKDRCRSRVVDGGHRRDKGEGHRDDLVAGADVGGKQGEMEGAGPGIDANPACRLTVGSELFLECGHFATERELATVENALDRGVHFGLDRRVLRLEIDERNHDVFP